MATELFVPRVLIRCDAAQAWKAQATVSLPDAALRHVRTVLRLADGHAVELVDGHGTLAAAELRSDTAVVATVTRQPAPAPRIVLIQALCAKDRLAEAVRCAVEAGVDEIRLVQARRSNAPYAAKPDKLAVRLDRVIDSAVAQSRRAYRPPIHMPVSLSAVAAQMPRAGWIGALDAPALDADAQLNGVQYGESTAIAVAIGPESGWETDEVAQLADRGLTPVRVPLPVLRVEHAGLVLVALAARASGRFGTLAV